MHNPIQYTDNISYPIITFKLFLYSDADQRKHQRSAPLAFVLGIHRWPVTGEFPAQMANYAENLPFDNVIMESQEICGLRLLIMFFG